MAWIELHQNMPGHRRTRRVKSILDIDTPTAVGHLCLLWLWALDNAEDGSIGGMLNQEIADVCEYKGDADAFVDALVEAGYLIRTDDDLILHDWADYCGRLMDKREQNRLRQQKYRERHRQDPKRAKTPKVPPAPDPPPEPPAPVEEPPPVQDPELAKAMDFYFNRINPTPSQSSIEELTEYIKTMGADVCIAAMEYAIDEHKGTWSYIRGTLRAYMQRGIRNMDDLRRAQEEFERKKQAGGHTHGNNRTGPAKHGPAQSGPAPGADPLAGFHTE